MKIFVDTNVWLAGRFGKGLCTELLDMLVRTDVEILVDERVLDEFYRIGKHKFGMDEYKATRASIFFHQYTRILTASSYQAPGIPDPDDAWIIAAALDAHADLFVTGDKALLALGVMEQMPIIDPRTAYNQLLNLL